MVQHNENGKDTRMTVNWKTKAGVSRSGLNVCLNVTLHFVCLYFLTLEHSQGWEAVRGAFYSPPVTLACQRMYETRRLLHYYRVCINSPWRKQMLLLRHALHKCFFLLFKWWADFYQQTLKQEAKYSAKKHFECQLLALTLMSRIEWKELLYVVLLFFWNWKYFYLCINSPELKTVHCW